MLTESSTASEIKGQNLAENAWPVLPTLSEPLDVGLKDPVGPKSDDNKKEKNYLTEEEEIDENDADEGLSDVDPEEEELSVRAEVVGLNVLKESARDLDLVWPTAAEEDFKKLSNSVTEWPNLENTSKETIIDWIRSNKKILLRAITWNMHAKKPPAEEVIQSKLIPRNK